ncbi:hypothetical protein LEMLEM_LOCUS18829, partial [Lemmus lemmus]
MPDPGSHQTIFRTVLQGRMLGPPCLGFKESSFMQLPLPCGLRDEPCSSSQRWSHVVCEVPGGGRREQWGLKEPRKPEARN